MTWPDCWMKMRDPETPSAICCDTSPIWNDSCCRPPRNWPVFCQLLAHSSVRLFDAAQRGVDLRRIAVDGGRQVAQVAPRQFDRRVDLQQQPKDVVAGHWAALRSLKDGATWPSFAAGSAGSCHCS
jgi:hypothetical protein